jgi:hypothetical protein
VCWPCVGDDRPLYVRRIHDCAFGRVLDSITQVLGVTLDEAQHLADMQGLTATSHAVVDIDCTRNVAATLERSDDFETQAAINASLANIDAYLAQSLPLPVHSWQMAAEGAPISCASGQRAALFGGAVALSALAWEAA